MLYFLDHASLLWQSIIKLSYRFFSKALLQFTSVVLFITSTCYADRLDDFYIQQALARYFPLPQNAQSISMGSSIDVNCNDGSCLFLNPSGLANLSKPEVVLSFGSNERGGQEFIEDSPISESSKNGYGIIAVPLQKKASTRADYGTLAIALSRYQGKVDDRISSTPDGHRRTFGYGYGDRDLSLGYTFTFFDDQLRSNLADLHSHARFLHLVGAQSQISETLKFGATIKYGLGQSDTEVFATRQDGLSRLKEFGVNIGILKEWSKFNLALSADYTHVRSRGNLMDVPTEVVIGNDEQGDVYGLHAGAEYKTTQAFSLRSGLRWYQVSNYEFKRPSLAELSGRVNGIGYAAGAGYVFQSGFLEKSALSYGVEYFTAGDGGWQHIATFTVPIG